MFSSCKLFILTTGSIYSGCVSDHVCVCVRVSLFMVVIFTFPPESLIQIVLALAVLLHEFYNCEKYIHNI